MNRYILQLDYLTRNRLQILCNHHTSCLGAMIRLLTCLGFGHSLSITFLLFMGLFVIDDDGEQVNLLEMRLSDPHFPAKVAITRME